MPAQPATVTAFLADCPCAPATQRRRVAAIDHHHAAGCPRPGQSPTVLAVLGRSIGEPHQPAEDTVTAVHGALRALPSHGWTQGMFGRRDRCLLVLSQVAGVSYQVLATLTAGDTAFVDGTATITTQAGTWSIRPADDGLLCGPCAVTRCVRVVDLAVAKVTTGTVAAAVDKAESVIPRSPHLCRSTRSVSEATLVVPVFSSINQWGALPFPLHRLTPHSLSRRVQDLLAGDMGAHRCIPVNPDQDTEPEEPTPAPVVERVYSRDDAQRAWARRRSDLDDLAGIDHVLDEVDARAKALRQRTAAVLAAENNL